MPRRFQLPLATLVLGLTLVFVHDYAYRRVDSGNGDYELWGAVSHAGSDMIVVVLALTALVMFWPGERR